MTDDSTLSFGIGLADLVCCLDSYSGVHRLNCGMPLYRTGGLHAIGQFIVRAEQCK